MALSVTDDSPSSGYIAWTGLVITRNDTEYSVANDNSNKKYLWWDYDSPYVLQESDTLPTLNDDDGDRLVFLNIDGTHYITIQATKIRAEAINFTSWRQDDTSDTYKEKIIFQHGWGYKLGDDSDQMSESITFPIEFSNKPIVLAQISGVLSGSDPTEEDDLVTTVREAHAYANNPSTTGFTVIISKLSIDGSDPGVLDSTKRFGYKWIAIGTVS